MTQYHWQLDLTSWFVQAVFFASVVHLIFYMPFFRWWETVTGRALVLLSAAMAGTLLHTILTVYGVIHVTVKKAGVEDGITDSILTWVSIVSLAGAAVAVSFLAFQALRFTFAESDNKFIGWLLMLGRCSKT